jgi:hypothetical protein
MTWALPHQTCGLEGVTISYGEVDPFYQIQLLLGGYRNYTITITRRDGTQRTGTLNQITAFTGNTDVQLHLIELHDEDDEPTDKAIYIPYKDITNIHIW